MGRRVSRTLRGDSDIVGPAGFRIDNVTRFEAIGLALQNLRDGIGMHHIAGHDLRAIGRGLHPCPVCRVNGHHQRATEKLAIFDFRHRALTELKMLRRELPNRLFL